MIKTFALLALLLLLYGLAGRVDFETSAATAQERARCMSCPCGDRAIPSPKQSGLERFVGSSGRAGSAYRTRALV